MGSVNQDQPAAFHVARWCTIDARASNMGVHFCRDRGDPIKKATPMIHVIATIEIKPGQRDGYLAEFRKLVPSVLAEAGCIEYGPTIEVATGLPPQRPLREDVVTIVEKWESVEHLKDHLAAPHMQEFRPRVKALVVNTSIVVLEPA
jgi:quinol monooxygenase YgiN